MLKGIAHISFVTSDMEKSLYYYCGVLGFKFFHRLYDEKGDPWLNYVRISDREYLELFYGGMRKIPQMENRAGFSHMCLQVDDIHAIAQRLKECGAPVDIEPKQGTDYNWQCWSHDSDGNLIEFMQIVPESPQAKA
jgi:catechol 2,3-dioxygenase-like lactoylglutathione lyase family enzyme